MGSMSVNATLIGATGYTLGSALLRAVTLGNPGLHGSSGHLF